MDPYPMTAGEAEGVVAQSQTRRLEKRVRDLELLVYWLMMNAAGEGKWTPSPSLREARARVLTQVRKGDGP